MGSFQPRPYQLKCEADIKAAFAAGHRAVMLTSPVASGKCLAQGTPVVKFNGEIVPVENLGVGDLLMGPRGPKRIMALGSGHGQLYRVTQIKGDSYVVNGDHVLSLKMTGGSRHSTGIPDGAIINMTVMEYLATTKTFKAHAKGYKSPAVNFPQHFEPCGLDPYFLGVWLGDGHSRSPSITTGDVEIEACVNLYAYAHGLRVRREKNSRRSNVIHITTGKKGDRHNHVRNALAQYRLLKNKHIPWRYKTGTVAERLAVLAGIIDTDGCAANGQYDLTLKSERLIDDIIFVARSLGFTAFKRKCRKTCGNNGRVGNYFRINIGGPVDEIPVRIPRKQIPPRERQKDHLVTGITIERAHVGPWHGFTLDGDGLFLLGDFTVTHNTVMFSRIAAGVYAKRKRVHVLQHRKELVHQCSEKMRDMGVPHGTILGGQPGVPRDHVITGSVQTMWKRVRFVPPPDLIIVDEAHRCIEDSAFANYIAAFPNARVLGVSASPQRTDKRPLSGIFDALVHGPSVGELIALGYLPPPEVYAPLRPDMSDVHVRRGDYVTAESEGAMNRPHITGCAVEHYKKLAYGKRAIIFCVSIKHAEAVADQFVAAGFRAMHVDGTMSDYERARRLRLFETGAIDQLTSVDLASEGLDIPGIEAAIMLRPTQSIIVHIQQMGRAMRAAPGKDRAIIIDACGNVFRHGLPDEPREWTLDGIERDAVEAVPRVITCERCFAAYRSPPCPRCGHVNAAKPRHVKQVDGDLGMVSSAADYDSPVTGDPLRDLRAQYQILKRVAGRRGRDEPEKWAWNIISQRLAESMKGSTPDAIRDKDIAMEELRQSTVERDRVERAMSKEG